MECVVYMGTEDVARQAQNVYRMKLLGATVVPVDSGSKTLKDALNEAMRDWVTNVEQHVLHHRHRRGPAPVSDDGARFQFRGRQGMRDADARDGGRQPDAVLACVGGGSNAMGIFYAYMPARGREADRRGGGRPGASRRGKHAASLSAGTPGVLHGNRTYLLQDANGQIQDTHSISAGLDYPGVGPEHAWLKDSGRARVRRRRPTTRRSPHSTTLCRHEGIIPALESSHAVAYADEDRAHDGARTRSCS